MKTIFKRVVMRSLTFLMAFGLLYLASACRSDEEKEEQATHKLVFKGIGSAGVQITSVGYSIGTETHMKTDLSVNQWSSEELTFKGNTPLTIGVHATGVDANSTLNAQIYVDGKLVKEGTSTGSILSANAAHNYQ